MELLILLLLSTGLVLVQSSPFGARMCGIDEDTIRISHGLKSNESGFTLTARPRTTAWDYQIVVNGSHIAGLLLYIVDPSDPQGRLGSFNESALPMGTKLVRDEVCKKQGIRSEGGVLTHSNPSLKKDLVFQWSRPSLVSLDDEQDVLSRVQVRGVIAGQKQPWGLFCVYLNNGTGCTFNPVSPRLREVYEWTPDDKSVGVYDRTSPQTETLVPKKSEGGLASPRSVSFLLLGLFILSGVVVA